MLGDLLTHAFYFLVGATLGVLTIIYRDKVVEVAKRAIAKVGEWLQKAISSATR